VNVRHGEELAERFRSADIPARSVSGRMSARDRQRSLEEFVRGEVRVVCACELLNEGWDCPDVEVLLMARPTLSKVIYLQQLGRGTRKAPGKECLVVFDFVDNASRYNQGLTLHRILGEKRYKPGALVLAPATLLQGEQEAFEAGRQPTQILPVELWARDYQEIDVFNWQDAVSGMVSSTELELQLSASEGRIRSAIERGAIVADHTLQLGEKTYYYLRQERAEEIREQLHLPRVDDENIRTLFLAYVKQMDLKQSYKPVMLQALLDRADEHGKARLDEVVRAFAGFYLDRAEKGQTVERGSARMSRVRQLSEEEIRVVMLRMPFEKFERRHFLLHDRQDLAFIRFNRALWRQLTSDDLALVRQACDEGIARYYAQLQAE
jgi:hypothetical protein